MDGPQQTARPDRHLHRAHHIGCPAASVHQNQLHGQLLRPPHRHALMVDHTHHVLVGSHRDDLPVEGDGPDLMAAHVQQPYLLLIGHRHPPHPQSNAFDVVPADLPRLPLDPGLQLEADVLVAGVDEGEGVEVEVLKLLVMGDGHLPASFEAELYLDCGFIVGLQPFDDAAVVVDEEETLALEHRGGRG